MNFTLVDSKHVLSISLRINESKEVLESAIYSDKESMVTMLHQYI